MLFENVPSVSPISPWATKRLDSPAPCGPSFGSGRRLESDYRSGRDLGSHDSLSGRPTRRMFGCQGPSSFKGCASKALWVEPPPIYQPHSTHMSLIGDFTREDVKVGLPSPHQLPCFVTSATQAFIKGVLAVLLYIAISLEGCIQLERGSVQDIQFSTTQLFLRLNCVWVQKPTQQL